MQHVRSVHVGMPEITAPVYARLSVILSEAVGFSVKRRYCNGGHCAAKHPPQANGSAFEAVCRLTVEEFMVTKCLQREPFAHSEHADTNIFLRHGLMCDATNGLNI